jgi:hypothetical protein
VDRDQQRIRPGDLDGRDELQRLEERRGARERGRRRAQAVIASDGWSITRKPDSTASAPAGMPATRTGAGEPTVTWPAPAPRMESAFVN